MFTCKAFNFFWIVFFSLTLSCEATTSPQVRNAMHEHLNAIAQMLENYPPAIFKQESFGWQVAKALAQAKFDLDNEPDVDAKFKNILIRFLGSARDRNVKIFFHSNELAILPIAICSFGDKYYICAIDPKEKDVLKKIQVGDEVTSWNGKPIPALITEYLHEMGLEDDSTNRLFAEEALTLRLGSLGEQLPQGQVTLDVINGKQKKANQVHFDWIFLRETPSPLATSRISSDCHMLNNLKSHSEVTSKIDDKVLMRFPIKDSCVYPNEQASYLRESLGYKDSLIPNLGEIIWKAKPDNHFHAYIFKDSRGKKIGFLRLASYLHKNNSSSIWEEFRSIISEMQKETDGLIIDQQDNPGGELLYCFGILSLLAKEPLETPMERLMLTASEVLRAYEDLHFWASLDLSEKDNYDSKIVKANFWELAPEIVRKIGVEYNNRKIKEWEAGNYLTDKMPLLGLREIPPDATVKYTKPILIIVNEKTMAAADIVASILQDNKRATILGKKTAGAGGLQKTYRYPPNPFSIDRISFTNSIIYRNSSSQMMVESVGVKPDVIYEKKLEDLTQNNKSFKEAILSQVKKMVP